MKIGKFEIPQGAYLAPMAGITDVVFRKICKKYNASLTCTEMISVQGLFYQPKKSIELMQKDTGHPQIVQIFGSDPKMMADTAKKYCGEFDIIDINMGCPAPKIVKGGAGSALMQTPQLAKDIVRAVADKTQKPITCKIRAGWDEDSINAIEFAGGLQEAGASCIALHARTRQQYYSGEADWLLIKKLKKALDIPVIGNGDILSAEDAERMLSKTGCDMVMIGRGAQGKPHIFNEIKEFIEGGTKAKIPALKKRMDDAFLHAKGLCEIFDEKNAVRMMRKHLAWYIKGERNAAQLRNKAVRVQSLVEIEDFLKLVICQSNNNT
jgi:tRNA-dihydrouridine synthase B